jgi:uncharacterized protein (TIGR02391 family)
MNPSPKVPPFTQSELLALAEALAETSTHSLLPGLLHEASLLEVGATDGLSKPKRIFNAIAEKQRQTATGNFAIKFTQIALKPHRYLNDPQKHEAIRARVNQVLAFRGIFFDQDAKVRFTQNVTTIAEAKARANCLKAELERRNVHSDVLAFCREELLQENYFHAVLEATKSLSDKIRKITGLTGDAGQLSQKAFGLGSTDSPMLRFNSLTSDTHKSEQTGLLNLFLGLFGAFRNVTAHGVKEDWPITEQDALDLLTLASLLHRRLDNAKPAARNQIDPTL